MRCVECPDSPGSQAVDLCGWAMEELDWRARAAAADALAASVPAGGVGTSMER